MALNAKEYLENSFLKDLLFKKGITDISYNGESLFYMDNIEGRKKSSITKTPKEVGDFLKQIANLCERQFSFSNPILDVSFSRYRINAVYSNLVRYRDEKTYSFSLRIASEKTLIEDAFFPEGVKEILMQSLKEKESIVIGGTTGCGKTELQKWLLLHLEDSVRVIVIDNVQELDLIRNEAIDQTTWVSNDLLEDGDFAALIKNSLRSNPDYVILAESRGAEFEYALNSVMSGHPIITTIHAQKIETMIDRMARLALMSGKEARKAEIIEDIISHFSLLIYMGRSIKEGKVYRYIDSVARLNHESKKLQYLYRKGETNGAL